MRIYPNVPGFNGMNFNNTDNGIGYDNYLAFDWDFAKTKALDPKISFTRASAATEVNSDGIIQWAPENLLSYSEEFDNSTWSKFNSSTITPNVVTAPDGTMSADLWARVSTGASYIYKVPNNNRGKTTYTLSVYVKKHIGSFFACRIQTNFPARSDLVVNLDSGDIYFGPSNTYGFSNSSAQVIELSDGWYRIIHTTTTSASPTLSFYFSFNSNGVPIDGVDSVNNSAGYLWGAQLERHSSARKYVKTDSSAYYGPRFDHDPVTGICKGFLIEESKTNYCTYSGNLTADHWLHTNATVHPTDIESPVLSMPFWEIRETDSLTNHGIANRGGTSNVTPVVSGNIYTASIFLKKVEDSIDWVQLTAGIDGFGSTQYVNVNLSAGIIGNSNTAAPPSIDDYGDGVYRVTAQFIATSTTNTANVVIGFLNNTNIASRLPVYQGSVDNRVLATAGQFEPGRTATSYIDTLSTATTRASDLTQIPTAGILSNIEASIYVDYYVIPYYFAPTATGRTYLLDRSNDGGSFRTTLRARMEVYDRNQPSLALGSGVGTTLYGLKYETPQFFNKVAVAYNTEAGASFIQNGTLTQKVDTTLDLANTSAFALGHRLNGTAGHVNFPIKTLKIYRKRLPDEVLIDMTKL